MAAQHLSAKSWILLIILSILWGGSFFFVAIAVVELPTFTVVVARVSLAAACLYAFMRLRGIALPTNGAVWAAFFGMGVLNNVIPFSLIVWGQATLASGVAAILNAMTPIFTVMVAHALTSDERLSRPKLIGVLLGFGGVAVLVGGDALSAITGNVIAQLAILCAALSYALASVFGRRFKNMGISPLATATGQVTASSVIMIPLMVLVDAPWTLPMPGLQTWAALVGLAVLSTAFAYVLYFKILEVAGATNLSLVTLLIPVSAIALGVAFLGEVLALRHGLGMALIATGLLIIDGRLWRARP